MKFITAEQFSKAETKVQDSIYEWWKPTEGDLCNSNIVDEMCCIRGKVDSGRLKEITGNTTPLLTVGQLMEFIEWKLDDEIDICVAGRVNYQIATDFNKYDAVTPVLIDALWEVAQKVCE